MNNNMENNNVVTIEDIIVNDSERVERKKKAPIVGIALFVVGAALIGLATIDAIPAGMTSMCVFSIGLVLFITGLVKTCSTNYIYFDKQSQTQLVKYDLYFDNSELSKLENNYKSRNFKAIGGMKQGDQSGTVLHLYGTKEGNLFYSMLMKFVPYQYVPVCDMVKHTEETEIASIIEMINMYTNNKK